MEPKAKKTTIHQRVATVLRGERPDRLPFIGRLELWHRGRLHRGTLPQEFQSMGLTQIHEQVGMGRQKNLPTYSLRLRGVEMVSRFNGDVVHQETDPVVDRFPDVDLLVPPGRTGVMVTDFICAAGRLTVEHTVLEDTLAAGARSYMSRHAIGQEADYAVVEHILERAETILQVERLRAMEAELGRSGFVVPDLGRIPFQQLLIDYMETTAFFYALHDSPRAVQRLLALLDARIQELLDALAELDLPYVEFVDNLDGAMTNPRLFTQYCRPAYQRYGEVLHGQGKKMGSHVDGNARPLLNLLAESGLDVIESFSPAPLTPCTFEEAWQAWRDGPLIWGGIPSPLLEPRTSQSDFEAAMASLFQTIGERPIILCVADMVLPNNEIERVRQIAARVEEFTP